MGREMELKFSATAQLQQQLRDRFGPFQSLEMESTYFDTPTCALSQQRITLRLRKENGISICTLKTPLPDGSRGEWECQADSIQDGVQHLLRLGAPAIPQADLLRPRCGAKFTRLATLVQTADGTAELALDAGILTGGDCQIPLCEVEVELKTGSDAACMAFAGALATQYGLTPESRSKFQRANALAQGE